MSAGAGQEGLGLLVPAAPPGLGAATAVNARPFVPGAAAPVPSSAAPAGVASAVHAKPFVPGGGSSGQAVASLPKSNSAVGLGGVNAAVFVPGGPAPAAKPPALNAKPFVPGGGVPAGSSPPKQQQQQQQAGAPRSPPGKQPLRAGSAAMGGGRLDAARAATLDLPDGDDFLGLTAVTPGDAKDVASQAAEMFRSLQPFQQQQQPQQAGLPHMSMGAAAAGRGRGVPPQQRSPRPPSRGGLGPPPPGFVASTASAALSAPSSPAQLPPLPPAAAPSAAGRGAAAGGRGRGRAPRRPGPSSSRPSSAYSAGPGRVQRAGAFVSEQLRQELQQRAYLMQAQLGPEAEGELGLPEVVQLYHTLYPLEDVATAAERPSQSLGVRSQVVKAVSGVDGQAYALRRVDGRQIIPSGELLAAAEEAVARWEPVGNHPHCVGLREAFVSNEWDSTAALYFVHDYHPGALSVEQAHMLPAQTAQGMVRSPATEEQLWSYLVQLTSALRCIHQAGLAARPACLSPSKVLLTSSGRVRIGSLGVPEALSEGGQQDVQQLQREDLAALGSLVLLLACVGRGGAPSLGYLTAHFSRELCHVVAGLLAAGEGTGFASWRSLAAALGDRAFEEMDTTSLYADALLGELGKEAENGRLLRLLGKLSFVNERPELGGDTQWAEAGDRYLLKLFRDFVFHQCDDSGAPLLDWGMVAEALNKVDAGVPEKVLLMSRDEMSMLVVSYADLRRCIEGCYAELRARAAQPGGGSIGAGGLQRPRSRAVLQ